MLIRNIFDMQNKKSFFGLSCIIALATIVFVSSCSKKFDEPPLFEEPNVTANKTIAELKAMHVLGQVESITDDVIIEGIVNADDRSGNYYKQISIQDSTGGITVRLDGTNLYTSYPVGRKIYIKLKGLFMGDYNGLIQLGGSLDNSGTFLNVSALASNLFDTYILKGSTGNTIAPKVVTVATLDNSSQSMLIQIDNAEFAVGDTNKTFADVANSLSVNLNVKSCSGANSIIVRTSGYSNFAGTNIPNGNGTLLSIYTTFGTTKQLIVRDTSDVKFYGDRCGSGPTTFMNISDLRALFTGATTAAPADRSITGVVISDRVKANINAKNLIIQQGTGLSGIAVRFDANHTFDLGDSITINIGGQEVSEFNGLLQLNNVPAGNAVKVASGKTITPRATTIADINTNFEAWESTLIKLSAVTLSPAGAWSASGGNTVVTSGANTIICYTLNAASFSGVTKPTGDVDMVAYTGQGGTTAAKQLSIRDVTDVSGGGVVVPPVGGNLLDENFESVTTTGNTPIALTGWSNVAETGGVQYLGKTFSNNKYAQITAFSSNQATVKSWLISPSMNLDNTTTETLTFKTKDGFNSGTTTLKVFYSTNFTGTGSPTAATWTELTAAISSGTTTGYAANFTNSGEISLSAITGNKVYIAFVYEGGTPTNTTTFQIDDVKVVGN